MSLFDTLVDEALRAKSDLHLLRPVVEKELLHHDILREMSEAGLLNGLTFIGGTCLRACYGSERLSEDLDFTGGVDFKKESLRSKPEVRTDFIKEMQRFLPVQTVKETVEREEFWEFLTGQVEELARLAVQAG